MDFKDIASLIVCTHNIEEEKKKIDKGIRSRELDGVAFEFFLDELFRAQHEVLPFPHNKILGI